MQKYISRLGLALGASALLAIPFFAVAKNEVTICHATGSETNRFVEITVSVNSLPAHFAHGDVLAPAAGCGSLNGGPGGEV